MSAEALHSALALAGIAAGVEGRERLALIRAADMDASRAIAARREEIARLAAAHGFTHVALEIAPLRQRGQAARSDAALPGD